MLAAKRRQGILKLVQEQGDVQVAELSQRFRVSPSTIRRDLEQLATRGALQRTFGGAVATQASTATLGDASDVVRRIGQAAADLITAGETVFIGPGPLCQATAGHLCSRSEVTILTNALEVAWTLYQNSELPLILTGGPVLRPGGALAGQLAAQSMETLRADRLIVEVAGVSPLEGFTSDQLPQAEMIRLLVKSVSQVVILTTAERLGRVGAAWIGPVSEADVIITGRDASSAIAWDLSETGVKVTLV